MLPLAAGTTACDNGIGFRLPDPNVRVIAFGDSATNGPAAMQYVDYLPALTGRPVNQFANEGIGGETTEDGAERLAALFNAGIFPNATHLIYWQGGNDIVDFIQAHDPLVLFAPGGPAYPFADELAAQLDAIESQMRAAIQAARGRGVHVVLVTYFFIPEAFVECAASPIDIILPGQAVVANAYTERLNDVIRALAAEEGATLVDIELLNDVLRSDLAHYENCNHLSAAGNDLVAQEIAPAL